MPKPYVKIIQCAECECEFNHYHGRQGLYHLCDDCNEPDVEQYRGLTVYANKHERHLTIGKGSSIEIKIQNNNRRNFGVITSMVERKSA